MVERKIEEKQIFNAIGFVGRKKQNKIAQFDWFSLTQYTVKQMVERMLLLLLFFCCCLYSLRHFDFR